MGGRVTWFRTGLVSLLVLLGKGTPLLVDRRAQHWNWHGRRFLVLSSVEQVYRMHDGWMDDSGGQEKRTSEYADTRYMQGRRYG